jgi:tetratricopeptide (TPR) repeat protein
MSLKDKGNQEVKKGNLPAAIECYLKYVEEEHQDNYTAFTNLALCYFKLKQHEKCIEACRNSIEHNPDNAKAYYRLYMTYKELPGQEYNTYINAQLFLKHFHDDNPTSQSEAIKIAKEYKEKFSKSVASKKMEEDLIEGLDVLGKDYRGKF